MGVQGACPLLYGVVGAEPKWGFRGLAP